MRAPSQHHRAIALVLVLTLVAAALRAQTRVAPNDAPAQEPRTNEVRFRRVNLNTASEGELDAIPGIGPTLARQIMSARNARGGFRSLDELDAIHGVGPALMRHIRSRAYVELSEIQGPTRPSDEPERVRESSVEEARGVRPLDRQPEVPLREPVDAQPRAASHQPVGHRSR